MSAQRTSFEKLQRDRAKKAKAAAKREKRLGAEPGGPLSTDEVDAPLEAVTVSDYGPELSAADLLQLVESLHKQFEAKTISYETFEEQKAELFGRLPID